VNAISLVIDQPAWDCHVHVFGAGSGALPGHYQPREHTLEQLLNRVQGSGVDRFVLVQPSVYGADNTILLQTLGSSSGQHRGVVVVDTLIDPDIAVQWHALGVRGIRFNRVSPIGLAAEPANVLDRWQSVIKELGWHVQWFVRPDGLGEVERIHDRYPLPCVLDHLGGLSAGFDSQANSWRSLLRLAHAGAWIKASAWYRLSTLPTFCDLKPLLEALAQRYANQMVWGSDWPHTSFPGMLEQTYASQLAPLEWLGPPTRARILRLNPGRLYR
jgi:predicted TIM-barrel fold metal-dependent hydrolase